MSENLSAESQKTLPVVVPTRTGVKSAKPIKGYIPAVERPEHRAMYAFYHSLGKNRTLQKVAREFGKSIPFVSTLSRAFRWQDRIRTIDAEVTDPVVASTRDKVNLSRIRLVDVVYDITDTLNELTMLSKKIKDGDKLCERDENRSEMLIKALGIYGFAIEKPKDMRDLITILKEITKFNADTQQQPNASGGDQNTQINVHEMKLVITDSD